MLAQITPVTDTLNLNLDETLDYILAEDVSSPLNVPPHNNSAMDGYAFSIEILQQSKTLILVGRSMAGASYQGECKVGQCIRIMTGAKMPVD
jgi:molybdopterin molybdotransferase